MPTRDEIKNLILEIIRESGLKLRPNYSTPLVIDTSITTEKTYDLRKLFNYEADMATEISVLSVGGGLSMRWNDNPTLTAMLQGDQIEEDIRTLVVKGAGAGSALLWISTRI